MRNCNIANQIHGFTIDYCKFILLIIIVTVTVTVTVTVIVIVIVIMIMIMITITIIIIRRRRRSSSSSSSNWTVWSTIQGVIVRLISKSSRAQITNYN